MSKKVGIIMGSTRPSRISPEVAKWAQQILNQGDVQYDVIDLKEVNLPFLDEVEVPMSGNYHNAHTFKWSQMVQSYDGVIFMFPQYNWGYPAALKNAIDYLGTEWANKPVSCITYGSHGGTQAYASMLLVMNGLKMKRLAVNPSISINTGMFEAGHFKNVDVDLKAYQSDLELLRMNFENELK